MSFLGAIYIAAAVMLALYGINSLVMLVLYFRNRSCNPPLPPLTHTPRVTVQLPIYNELYVVERLIDAVVALDYPRDHLQIQVLDDSTDETTAMARERAAYHRQRGFDIVVVHRSQRTGFKAGALAHGLNEATGEFVAIFDADFVPGPDFLRQTVPHFLAQPDLGLIQTRWGHINGDYSPLTRAQTLALDGHFVVEQTARQRAGLFMNFNGTAGIWRRDCIEDSGGWQGDTLSEDLDLSYRAQLRGWRFLFLPNVVSPAEVPPQVAAFKRQQFRWAKGSIQCLRKLGRAVLTTQQPLFKRIQGLIHLSGYLVHPLMLVLLLASLPLMLWEGMPGLPLAYLSLASAGPPLLYAVAQRSLYTNWRRRWAVFPVLVMLGTGVALSNTWAVVGALLGRRQSFQRTPKYRLESQGDRWRGKEYALPFSWMTLGEAALAFYAGITVIVACLRGNVYAVPFLLLYVAGFGYVAVLGLLHSTTWPRLPVPRLRVSHEAT
ncbi:MAG: cellulose synthase family protein, partial [Chloroflexota bacterium]|nr:cellulose synthase family protein [Chloroflexota bacterium]